MRQTVALFGEAEKGEIGFPLFYEITDSFK